jgi:exodeoxyribonuclease VII small subunit
VAKKLLLARLFSRISANSPETLAGNLFSGGKLRVKANWTPRPRSSSFPRVPKSAKSSTTHKLSGISFEDALKKLEVVVEEMESDELPLESLLKHYEEGTQLASVCQKQLAEAELKIQKLEKNASGNLELKPFPLGDDDAEQDSE